MLHHKGTQTIDTERLTLRPFRYTDNDDMLTYWVSDPNIQSLYSEPTYNTREEVKGLLDQYIASYEKPDYYRWAVIHKVQVCHKEGNIASQGVIRKCHFTYEGTLRDFFFTDGKYVSRLYYSMLKDEYEKLY